MNYCSPCQLGNCVRRVYVPSARNRIGYTVLSVAQLKVLQEVVMLTMFVPFALFSVKEPLQLDYVWAALCILAAVYFLFRSRWLGGYPSLKQ
jgi:uncharacterized protein (DUF486 family)